MIGNMIQYVRGHKGQGMTEYALILGFIALCLVLLLGSIPAAITGILSIITEALGTAP